MIRGAQALGPQPPLSYEPAASARAERSPSSTGSGGNCDKAWPFPFDPPDPAGPGDNRAMACNTTDGSILSDLAVSLLMVTDGSPVYQSNEAHAYANCKECRTIAVAFQVILILGSVDEIAPVNAAVAANYDCKHCDTYAFAYQLIVTITKLPSEGDLKKLTEIISRVRKLDLNSLSPDEIYLALEKAKRDVLEVLARSDLLGLDDSVATTEGDPLADEATSQVRTGTRQSAADTSSADMTTTAAPSPTTTPETTTTTTPETTTTTTPETTTTTSTTSTTTTTTPETTTTTTSDTTTGEP